jgi:hypothetical protein
MEAERSIWRVIVRSDDEHRKVDLDDILGRLARYSTQQHLGGMRT